ncbi:unnamed protein product [Colias eurytheme]|nr:unnamed protein product [Colias eurytheme]
METKKCIVKCYKCRNVLVDDLQTSSPSPECILDGNCNSYDVKSFIYLLEDKLPEWIKNKVEEEQWTKGKLHCSNCGCKVGSFDFVSGRKCECRNSVLPPVHFITSQVDIPLATLLK